jgi:hypothetical protein
MIYQSYNFVDSYSNASGNRKNSMVLGELGKVIKKEPKAVISALKEAGIKVPRNASRKDIVRLILANRRNKNLIQNLSVLITANATTKNSFLNFDEDTLPTLSGSQGLKGIAKGTGELAGTEDTNKGSFLKSIGDFFQKRKEQKQLDPTTKTTPAEESAFKRFSNWFSKNRDTIGQVGTTLYNSLGTANQNDITGGAGAGAGGNGGAGSDQTWIQRNKVLVVVGILAIAGGIYFMNKGKKGKK